MRKKYLISCLAFTISCTSTTSNQSSVQNSKDSIIEASISTKDTTSITIHSDSSSQEHYENSNESAEKIIEKKYGVQWDFCDCIRKNDSIQKAIDSSGDIDDIEFELLMARFEEIDNHCKSIISSPNTTPDQRKTHERRVKKCLGKN
ncbi:MAG: hypothetical protein AB8B74_13840 [Crocinitomicaceae bacterium]